MSKIILSAETVAIIARTAKSTKQRNKFEAYTLLKRADERLKGFTNGTVELAPDVRLSKAAVISLLWKIRKLALAQWKAAKAEPVAAPEPVAPPRYPADLPYLVDQYGNPLFV